MIKVVQIGSLFYCVVEDEDGNYRAVSEGYPTYEMALSFTGVDDL